MSSFQPTRARRGLSSIALAVLAVLASSAMAQEIKEQYGEFEGGPLLLPPDEGLPQLARQALGFAPAPTSATPVFGSLIGPSSVTLSFKGVSQFDLRNLLAGSSYIPPDTHGAIGATQYMETTNGVYGIYNKSTGALQSMVRADTFWAAAGATGGLNGDARIMFDAPSQRWIAVQFGASVANLQIAVSKTSDALGAWQSTSFVGFAGGTADYPTLAIDSSAIYIGTNNFNGSNAYAGTTMNVIPRSDLLGPTAPSAAAVKQFVTPYVAGGSNADRGFAIQGVNSTGPVSGRLIADSAFIDDKLRYNIVNPGTPGATQTAVTYLGATATQVGNGGRQPDGTRNIDVFDTRIASSVWEKNGKIYMAYGATAVGADHNEVRWMVLDATTNAVIQEGVITDPNYDFYQPSLSVNDAGQVVIGYNRSGTSAADGKVSVYARTYNSDASGKLVQTNELLLHTSTVANYHNGSVEGAAATGRQRWGDYSSVTVDPNDPQNFWVVGEYAEAWNNAAGCSIATTPGCTGTGGSTWGTWIAEVTLAAAVPEPQTYLLMLAGMVALGVKARRRLPTAA